MAKKDNKTTLIVVVVILGVIAFLLAEAPSNIGPAEADWQKNYLESLEKAGINPSYLKHDQVIDTNDQIKRVSGQIANESVNAKDAIKGSLDYVYQTVDYSPSSPAVCFQETAVDVYEIKVGNCVSMTKLNIAILREMGFAVRPAGGCISGNFVCGVLFSAHPERTPRYVPVDLKDPFKRGGLHEWFEVWLPDEGWIIGEATSGQIFSKSCQSYDYYDYSTDPEGMCVIRDLNYIRQCGRF